MWNPFSKNVAALLLIGSLSCATVSGTLIFEKLDDRIEYDDAQKLITIPETVTNMEGTVHLLLGTITSDVCGNCVKDGNHQITVAVEEENKLYLKRQLDYDSADLCTPGQKCQKTLRFREDSGFEQVLTVEITDENDNKPYFKATEDCRSLNVAENDDTGPAFCVLEATDDDYDDRTNTDNPSIIAKLENYRDLFELIRTDNSHEFTLKLQNGKSCDYETNYIHRLQISLTDGEPGHESILQSVVEVEDKPDMPPVWNRLSLSTKILETHEVGAEVLKFQAVDGDRGVNDKMNYEINVGPNVDDHTYFKYVENTETNEGTIELALHLDASKLMETRGSLLFEVGVKAVEREDPHDKVEEIISINIVDENINPVLISKNNEQEPEEKVEIEASCKETDKDCVISFTAIDKDVDKNNNKFEASWSTNADPGLPLPDWFLNAFVLEKSTGQAEDLTGYGEAEYRIRVKDVKYIDYDTIPEWRDPNGFTIKVTIKGVDDHKPAEAIITIHIENENDNSPYFPGEQTFEVLVPENQKEGYQLDIALKAEDDDEGEEFGKSSLSYEWEPNSRIPDYLEMDRTKGLITVTTKEAFDYEMFKSETFIVRVSDNRDGNDGARKNQITVSLKIIVVNINDEQPSIRAVPSRLSIDENTKNFKESEFKLNPFDPDEELSDLKCTLSVEDYLADSNVHNWFEVVNCETINIIGDIDREIDLKENKGSFIERITLKIEIEDLNTDPDYQETKSKDEIRITVSIIDLNDEAPEFSFEKEGIVFSESNFKLGETDPDADNLFKRKIVDIIATDSDANTKYTFTIITNGLDGMIELGENPNFNGKVSLQRIANVPIDREELNDDRENDVVSVVVRVSDTINVAETSIEIRIEDIDDNAPAFQSPPTRISVKENLNTNPDYCNNIKQELATITAIDADLCDEEYSKYGCVSYVFEGDQSTYRGFAIDLTTGELITDGCSIDRDIMSTPEIQLKILAYGDFREGREKQPGMFSEHTITIIVEDVNDNSPVFLTPSEDFLSEVEEELAASVAMGKIEIQDIDAGENGTITVEILEITCERNGEESVVDEPFRIREGQGQIGNTLTVQLESTDDFDFTYAYGLYSIKFRATDNGEESKPIEKIYKIKINDINNNYPVMDDTYDDESFSLISGADVGPIEIADGSPLPLFNATDDDEPDNPNSILVYQIQESSEPELWKTYFMLIPSTGELQLIRTWIYDIKGPLKFKICVKASDSAQVPKVSEEEVCYNLNIREPKKPPYFGTETQPMTIKENSTANSKVGSFEPASNADVGEPTIYYSIAGFGEHVKNSFVLNDKTKNDLSTKVTLDREEVDVHEVLIFASNDENFVPPYLNDPSSYEGDISYTRITVNVQDIVDEAPEFAQKIFTAGVATFLSSNIVLDETTIKATDKDSREIDNITYVLAHETIKASDPSLVNIQSPQFALDNLGEDGAILRRTFEPQSSHRGYFDFNIIAYDSLNYTGEVTVRVFFVRPEYAISFIFSNDHTHVRSKKSIIEELFSEAYDFICNVDNIDQTSDDSSGSAKVNSTTVETHFVDLDKEEMIAASIIEGWLYENPSKLSDLITKLNNEGIYLQLDNPTEKDSVDGQTVIIYALVAGCAVLGVVLLILGASCYFRNRGMARKVRALSAGAAPQIGMKEKGMEETLPGTNAFALKGSNPMWAEEGDNAHKISKFGDNESITSGGSILVGVELEDDFKGHEDRENPAFEDEFNSENEDGENLYGSIRNPAYNETYDGAGDDNYSYPTGPSLSNDANFNPMGSVARRNPLMSLEDD